MAEPLDEPLSSVRNDRLDRREFLRLGAATAGLVVLGGCGSQQSTGGTSGSDFKLGVVLPSSGVYADPGQSIVNGMTLYFEQVGNKAGNRKIVMLKEDETNDPTTALTKTRKLVEQDAVDMMSGYVATPDIYNARDYLHQSKVVTIVANAGGNLLSRSRKSPYIYRTSFSAWQIGNPIGKYVAEKVSKRVVVTNADYGFGNEWAAAFKETFTAGGGQVVGEVKAPLATTDYGTFLTKIAASSADTIAAFYAGLDAINFLKQARQVNLFGKFKLTCAADMIGQDVIPAVGDAAPLGAIGSQIWAVTLDNKENKSFVEAYQKKFNKFPDQFALQGFDSGRVIVEALNAVKGDTSDKDKLLKAIAAVTFKSPRGTFKFYTSTNNIINTI